MGQCNYSASKAGVIGLTKSMAKELAQFDIRVNALLPGLHGSSCYLVIVKHVLKNNIPLTLPLEGFIETPMVETVPENVRNALLKLIPAGRMGTPDG